MDSPLAQRSVPSKVHDALAIVAFVRVLAYTPHSMNHASVRRITVQTMMFSMPVASLTTIVPSPIRQRERGITPPRRDFAPDSIADSAVSQSQSRGTKGEIVNCREPLGRKEDRNTYPSCGGRSRHSDESLWSSRNIQFDIAKRPMRNCSQNIFQAANSRVLEACSPSPFHAVRRGKYSLRQGPAHVKLKTRRSHAAKPKLK